MSSARPRSRLRASGRLHGGHVRGPSDPASHGVPGLPLLAVVALSIASFVVQVVAAA